MKCLQNIFLIIIITRSQPQPKKCQLFYFFLILPISSLILPISVLILSIFLDFFSIFLLNFAFFKNLVYVTFQVSLSRHGLLLGRLFQRANDVKNILTFVFVLQVSTVTNCHRHPKICSTISAASQSSL